MSTENPYAPSHVESLSMPIDTTFTPSVTTWKVAGTTVVMICLSGGLFGIVLGLIPVAIQLSVKATWNEIGGLFMLIFIAFAFGVLLAMIASVPIVALSCLVLRLKRNHNDPWTPRSIRVFGGLTGALSGFLSVGWVSGVGNGSLFLIVPGIFAAITVPLFMSGLVKKCREERGMELKFASSSGKESSSESNVFSEEYSYKGER